MVAVGPEEDQQTHVRQLLRCYRETFELLQVSGGNLLHVTSSNKGGRAASQVT